MQWDRAVCVRTAIEPFTTIIINVDCFTVDDFFFFFGIAQIKLAGVEFKGIKKKFINEPFVSEIRDALNSNPSSDVASIHRYRCISLRNASSVPTAVECVPLVDKKYSTFPCPRPLLFVSLSHILTSLVKLE